MDEASLLAMARESEEGKVLVATGAEIALTTPLFVYQGELPSWAKNYHCERPLRSAGCGVGWG